MENATKALLIAGAIIIILAVLSLLVVFWDDIAIYFTATHEEKMLQQLIEFNNKFANYDGKEIRGNELVSIMNRVVDYNNFQSEVEGYEPIKITIDLRDKNEEFLYGGESGGNRIIKVNGNITNKTSDTNIVNDTEITNIATTSSRLVTNFPEISKLTDTKLQRLSAGIETIVYDLSGLQGTQEYKNQIEAEYAKNRANFLTKILGYTVSESDTVLIEKIQSATYQYYQYTMFKRAVFECKRVLVDGSETAGISYNQENGRVNTMNFTVVLEDGKVKFD